MLNLNRWLLRRRSLWPRLLAPLALPGPIPWARTSPRPTSPVPISVPRARTTPASGASPRAASPVSIPITWARASPRAPTLSRASRRLPFRIIAWHCPRHSGRCRRGRLRLGLRGRRRWWWRLRRLASPPFSVPIPKPRTAPAPRASPPRTAAPHVPVRGWRRRHAPWTSPPRTAAPHVPVWGWRRWRRRAEAGPPVPRRGLDRTADVEGVLRAAAQWTGAVALAVGGLCELENQS